MSRSLVGSSSSSTSAGSSISRAISTRACSPPERRPTGVSSCSDRNRKRLAQPATWIGAALEDHGVAVRARACARARAPGSSRARCWSNDHDAQVAARARPSPRPAAPARPAGAAACVLPLPLRAEQAEAHARRRARGRGRARSSARRSVLRQALRDQQALRLALGAREVDARRPRCASARRGRPARPCMPSAPRRCAPAPCACAPWPCARATPARRARGCAATPGTTPGRPAARPSSRGTRCSGRAPRSRPAANARFSSSMRAGHGLQEVAVVAHGHEGLRLAPQQLLEPEDALDVEMVRGLVEQQQLGLARQLARDGEPLLPAAGERRRGLRARPRSPALPMATAMRAVALVRVEPRVRRARSRSTEPTVVVRREHRILRRRSRCAAACARSASRRRAARGRPGSSATSTCPSRSGRRGRCGRPRRSRRTGPRTAARRRTPWPGPGRTGGARA